MDLGAIPFTVTTWKNVPTVEHKGETGTSHWRVHEAGPIRIRMVEYSPGFRSDHWCAKGHIFFVVDGEFDIRLKDGRRFTLGPGMSFEAGDDAANPHLGESPRGATVFIVD